MLKWFSTTSRGIKLGGREAAAGSLEPFRVKFYELNVFPFSTLPPIVVRYFMPFYTHALREKAKCLNSFISTTDDVVSTL
jgi:hypothetical protein